MGRAGAAVKRALLVLVAASCAHQTPEQRAAEAAHEQRCAAIEIYPPGMSPARPYQVLGPVGANTEVISMRDRALRDSACALGADAVIDVHEQSAQSQDPYAASANRSVEVSGTAVSWSDTAH